MTGQKTKNEKSLNQRLPRPKQGSVAMPAWGKKKENGQLTLIRRVLTLSFSNFFLERKMKQSVLKTFFLQIFSRGDDYGVMSRGMSRDGVVEDRSDRKETREGGRKLSWRTKTSPMTVENTQKTSL